MMGMKSIPVRARKAGTDHQEAKAGGKNKKQDLVEHTAR